MPGPVGLVSEYGEAATAPANTAFLVRTTDGVPAARAELVHDAADGTAAYGTLVFYSEENDAALYTLETPLAVGHEYEVDTPYRAARFVATAAEAESTPAAPEASLQRVEDHEGDGCGWSSSCGDSTSHTFDGAADLGAAEGFYAVRYAETEAEARTVRPITELTTMNLARRGPRSGWAAISRFDARGRESERTVVPIVDENEGGCRATPHSSGAQLFAWLAVAALIGRRLRVTA